MNEYYFTAESTNFSFKPPEGCHDEKVRVFSNADDRQHFVNSTDNFNARIIAAYWATSVATNISCEGKSNAPVSFITDYWGIYTHNFFDDFVLGQIGILVPVRSDNIDYYDLSYLKRFSD